MKCPKCSAKMTVRHDAPYTKCPSCGRLEIHAHPLPKPAKVREKISPEGHCLIIDSRNPVLGGLLIAAFLMGGAFFLYLLLHDGEMSRMASGMHELLREEPALLLLPMVTTLIWPIAAVYLALTLSLNRKILTVTRDMITLSAAPLPPVALPCRVATSSVKSIKVETSGNGGSYSVVVKRHDGSKVTIWPADTEPLLALYIREKVNEYLEEMAFHEENSLYQQLSRALDNEDCNLLRSLLDGHPELAGRRSAGGRTPLTVAASDGSTSLAKLLLDAGADVNMADRKDQRTALHYACLKGHYDMVQFLVEHKADVNAADSENATPLHLAQAGGHREIAEKLAALGAKDRITFKVAEPAFSWAVFSPFLLVPVFFLIILSFGYNNIHMAASLGNLNRVKSLLKANPHLLNEPSQKLNETPLQVAAQAGRLEVVKYLVQEGADERSRRAALIRASEKGHREVVEYLLHYVPNVMRSKDGRGPLHGAAGQGRLEVVKLLVEKKFDVNAMDIYGITPLDEALGTDWLDVARYLVEKGADVNSSSQDGESEGRTPLHFARSDKAVRLLVKKGVDVNARDRKGRTPLHHAARGFGSAVEELIASGADINARDNDGRTPLFYARGYRYSSRVLMEHGAKQ